MKKLKILVLCDYPGPPPASQEFTEELKKDDWKTEANVVNALKELGHEIRVVAVYDDISAIIGEVKTNPPDVAFNLVEQFKNFSHYERNIAALLELFGLPYTGCDVPGLMICKNKGLTKKILTYHRVKVPDFAIFPCGKPIHRPKRLRYPVFIKPLRDQGSYGIAQASFVESDADFMERVHFIHDRFHQDAIAEEYIEGRELYVSVLGSERLEVFPVREMIFSEIPDEEPKFATFKAKWDMEYRKRWGIKNTFADKLPKGIPEGIVVLAKKVYHALQIRGYARLDLRLTPQGSVVVIEANPNPMLAKDEDFALSAQRAGLEYPQLIQRILNLALRSQD